MSWAPPYAWRTVILVSILCLGCAPPALSPPEADKKAPKNTGLSTDLPSRIELKEKPAPTLANEDGTLRIAGFLARPQDYLNQTLEFKGYLLSAPNLPTAKNTKGRSLVVSCSDNLAGDGSLLTVKGIDHKTGKSLRVGQQYVVNGTLEQAMYGSQGVFALSNIMTIEKYERAKRKAAKKALRQKKKRK